MSKQSEFNKVNSFAHMFYCRLSDTTKELTRDYINFCVKYLSNHEGQIHFSVGYRALEIDRPVSAKNFHVSVHMIFLNYDAYIKYSNDPRHLEFITMTAGMSTERIVYDSFIHQQIVSHHYN